MPVVSTDALDTDEKIPGFLGRFLHGENMSVARWSVEAGAEFPEHEHPHEQISIVVEGEFALVMDEKTNLLRPGRIAIIPSGTPHAGRARTECEIIDVFSPVREDYQD